MKPFFSLRIAYRPADTKDMTDCNEHVLSVKIAREEEWDELTGSSQAGFEIARNVSKALQWLDDLVGYRKRVLSDAIGCLEATRLCAAMESWSQYADDDERNELLAAIERGRAKAE